MVRLSALAALVLASALSNTFARLGETDFQSADEVARDEYRKIIANGADPIIAANAITAIFEAESTGKLWIKRRNRVAGTVELAGSRTAARGEAASITGVLRANLATLDRHEQFTPTTTETTGVKMLPRPDGALAAPRSGVLTMRVQSLTADIAAAVYKKQQEEKQRAAVPKS
jgi:hypothetical protein